MQTCTRCKSEKEINLFHWAEKDVTRKKICASCLNSEALIRKKVKTDFICRSVLDSLKIDISIEAKLFNPMTTKTWQ